jgi:hypothetical protein
LQRIMSDFGSEHSFAHGNQLLKEHYGISLSPSAVREATLLLAKRARCKDQARCEQSFRILPAKGAAIIIAQADGSLLCTVEEGKKRDQSRPRQWKEIRLVATQAHGKDKVYYGATFGSVDEVGRRWGHCARDAGWGLNSRVHALGDGANWIYRQCMEVFGEQASFLNDLFHLSQYLAAAGKVIEPRRERSWLKLQQKRLKRGASEKVLAALEPHLEASPTEDEHAPVRCAWRYINNRLGCLDYPAALQEGLPIGSGLIEAGHKHVLQIRLKKPGAAWLEDNVDAMAHLRVVRANGQWESLWEKKKAA